MHPPQGDLLGGRGPGPAFGYPAFGTASFMGGTLGGRPGMQSGLPALSYPLGGNLATAVLSSLGAPPVPGRTYTPRAQPKKKKKKKIPTIVLDTLPEWEQEPQWPAPLPLPPQVPPPAPAPWQYPPNVMQVGYQPAYGPPREQWTQPPMPMVAGPTMPFAGYSIDQVAVTSPWASEIRCPRYCAQPHHHHHHHGGCE